tara:strand:- start:1418 stop:2068 length:651 start_codon:yes stop_codon:yes gene_type:complete
MPIPALMIAGVAMSAASAAIAAGKANSMNSTISDLNGDLETLANNRQDIPDLSANLKDLSDQITNPYANIGVATKAAQIQMEQTDLALANTLDTLAMTGAGAGGATALARAAAQSKQNVAANIEQQEAANEKLRAQGEQQRQQQLMAEQIRMQEGQIAADKFMFAAQETREMQELDRAQALYDNALAQQMQYQSDAMGALTGTATSLVSMGGTLNP